MFDQAGAVAVLERSPNRHRRGITVGTLIMTRDGAIGEIERIMDDLVICRLLTAQDNHPATAGYPQSEVTAIHQPTDVVSANELAALGL